MAGYTPIRYINVRFECTMLSSACIPAYQGSMLRGCLGTHLRNGLCMTRSKDCGICILGKNCIFPRIFNPAPFKGLPIPPPFCIEPDLSEKTVWETGETFAFNLKLFSYGTDYLPFFVQAFRMAGEKGIGSPDRRGGFTIEKIISAGKNIYNAGEDNLVLPEAEILPDPEECSYETGISRQALHLLTPLRYKNENRFSAALEFTSLFHLILRRIRSLYLCEGISWEMEAEKYRDLNDAAAKVRIARNSLRWHDWTRYSSRQDTRMKLGGLVGEIAYCGELSGFSNILRFAQIAHIGKQTSFGLGRCELT